MSQSTKNVQPQRVAVRTGTWQFISAQLLKNLPGTVEHSRADDLESFFHVLCWITLIYGPHSLEDVQVTNMLSQVYDSWWESAAGGIKGGHGKVVLFILREMKRKAQLKDGPLKDLIVELEDALSVRYQKGPSEVEWDNYNESKALPGYTKLVATHPVQLYLNSVETLKQSDWMLALFDAAIAQPDELTDELKKRAINTLLGSYQQNFAHHSAFQSS
ncbi:hypothetical protein MPER_05312 [Moniliophthora perniciosa FA553]|nr:hypothetical protein MPER_05312 [Moniliophthora perniciosa FA553]